MKYMDTYNGILIDPLAPVSGNIIIEDIAHALSLLCRGGGHLNHFYSVGQHSINCAKEAKAQNKGVRIELACLLHDASEAYLSDIIRPVKQYLPEYYNIEEKFQKAVFEKYHLSLNDDEIEEVKIIDDLMLINEMDILMSPDVSADVQPLCAKCNFDFVPFEEIEGEFIKLASDLTNMLFN